MNIKKVLLKAFGAEKNNKTVLSGLWKHVYISHEISHILNGYTEPNIYVYPKCIKINDIVCMAKSKL